MFYLQHALSNKISGSGPPNTTHWLDNALDTYEVSKHIDDQQTCFISGLSWICYFVYNSPAKWGEWCSWVASCSCHVHTVTCLLGVVSSTGTLDYISKPLRKYLLFPPLPLEKAFDDWESSVWLSIPSLHSLEVYFDKLFPPPLPLQEAFFDMIFYCCFCVQGSSWTLQAEQMDGDLVILFSLVFLMFSGLFIITITLFLGSTWYTTLRSDAGNH
jgi:hypothetical protein